MISLFPSWIVFLSMKVLMCASPLFSSCEYSLKLNPDHVDGHCVWQALPVMGGAFLLVFALYLQSQQRYSLIMACLIFQ